ncbi:hypothetical protein TWF730_001717 [Orbilia blumenaviensis]|uniref:Mid2 domain-containing protein n=1 Tax=Orbilia blumenaviensis TaxID=1796055 RepID=A0AAV9UMX1_9PEZI
MDGYETPQITSLATTSSDSTRCAALLQIEDLVPTFVYPMGFVQLLLPTAHRQPYGERVALTLHGKVRRVLRFVLRKAKVIWDAPITVCRDGKICCGNKEDLGGICCNEGRGVEIAATLLRDTEPTLTSTSSRSTSTETATTYTTVTTFVNSPPKPDPTSTPSASSVPENKISGATTSSAASENQALDSIGMSNTAKIAIGVGVPVAVVVIVSAVLFVRWLLKRSARENLPQVYEKNTIGPVEIGTSQIVNNLYPPASGPYHTQPPPIPRHHVNIHELQ